MYLYELGWGAEELRPRRRRRLAPVPHHHRRSALVNFLDHPPHRRATAARGAASDDAPPQRSSRPPAQGRPASPSGAATAHRASASTGGPAGSPTCVLTVVLVGLASSRSTGRSCSAPATPSTIAQNPILAAPGRQLPRRTRSRVINSDVNVLEGAVQLRSSSAVIAPSRSCLLHPRRLRLRQAPLPRPHAAARLRRRHHGRADPARRRPAVHRDVQARLDRQASWAVIVPGWSRAFGVFWMTQYLERGPARRAHRGRPGGRLLA